ncbi:hypothetical protein [Staphylococcus debuckii]|uniref:hypothetical protein n=1 Tax=Staphylococcus debuckii TaxID=2044912 RepID=UPI000F438A80|nr:hypothetical protein [Staphylococcus debuckii]AYU54615.1 hypothetical protein CNQ82_03915 [Staphylococcus debuckii]
MKKILFFIFAACITLAACGNVEKSNQNEEKKTSDTHDKKDKTDKGKKKPKNEDNNNQAQSSNDENNQTTESTKDTTETQPEQNQINVANITDRVTLESVIFGNYSEIDKIQAYNSAVANGVIPQGNVMEGPASAAYQSSLRVESGAEKSVYEQSSADNEQPEDVNAEINSAQNEEEYVNALRKKYNGGLSTQEMQTKTAIEQGYYDGDDGPEVYQKIQEREADINAGKYDQYKQ